jgi:hypothetical protein
MPGTDEQLGNSRQALRFARSFIYMMGLHHDVDRVLCDKALDKIQRLEEGCDRV